MPTLGASLSDLVSTLNQLRNNTTDPAQQQRLQKVLRVLFALWEETIHQQLDQTAANYLAAMKSISDATAAAKAAIANIQKVAAAINAAANAAKAVDQVLGLFIAAGGVLA